MRSESFCADAGMPVIGSRRVLRCAIVHAGVTLRSEAEFADLIKSGMSDEVCGADMMELGYNGRAIGGQA